MIVDIHAHYFPQGYMDLLMRIGGKSLPEAARPLTGRPGGRPPDTNDMQVRLERMDDAGVQMQVLSPAASPPYAEKEADAVAAARLINDAYAELAAKHPGRFNAVVSLPLPHIDASLREMERGLDQLGMLGVSMTCSCFDRSTAEAEFEPLYQEMNRRRTVLNYHPIQNGICSPMINDYGFTVSVGASLEDAAQFLERGATALSVKPGRIGITQAARIAELAAQQGANLCSGMYAESALGTLISLQLSGALREPLVPAEQSFYLMMREQILREPLRFPEIAS